MLVACAICGKTISPHENLYNLYRGTFKSNNLVKQEVTICWECSKEIYRRVFENRYGDEDIPIEYFESGGK